MPKRYRTPFPGRTSVILRGHPRKSEPSAQPLEKGGHEGLAPGGMLARPAGITAIGARRPAGVRRRTQNSGDVARVSNLEAPGDDLGRDSGALVPLPQLGLGRVGPSGSEATGWHHYDGAREISRERSRGATANGRIVMPIHRSASQGGIYLDTEETAGSPSVVDLYRFWNRCPTRLYRRLNAPRMAG